MFRVSNVRALRGVGAPEIKCTPLMVKGILYLTIPDHVFAVDAHTGDELWHYDWQDQGGHLVGNRGVGLYGDWLYFLAPDGWLISLGAKNGKERWRKKVADEKLQYFTTGAPLIVAIMCWWASAETRWMFPDIWSRGIPKPVICSGGGIPNQRPENRKPKLGPTKLPGRMEAE